MSIYWCFLLTRVILIINWIFFMANYKLRNTFNRKFLASRMTTQTGMPDPIKQSSIRRHYSNTPNSLENGKQDFEMSQLPFWILSAYSNSGKHRILSSFLSALNINSFNVCEHSAHLEHSSVRA